MNIAISEMQLKQVEDAETVCRLISSPLGYNVITGVSPDSFRLFRKNESYISVERLSVIPLESIMAGGDNIRKWFADGESFWGVALLSVSRIRNNPRLDVVPKPSPSHPSHAGIEMFLDSGVLYKSCADEPTPHEILILQLYLSSIIEKVIEK